VRSTPFLGRLASRRLSVPLAFLVAALIVPTMGVAAAAPLDLGTADNYALVANTTITNTGVTLIDGNLALVGPSVTGFLPGVITGRSDIGNAAATKAEADVLTAHHAATASAPVTEMAGDLGGQTLLPGIYHFGVAATLHGTLTLDGEGQTNPVFIFQIGTTLTTGTGARVILTNHAAGCAVFWAVGSSATIGTATSLQGNLMALVSITMNTGASIGVGGGRNGGRAFAQNGAITLDTNTVIAPSGSCVTPAPTPRPTARPTPRPTPKPTPVRTPIPPSPTPRAVAPTPIGTTPRPTPTQSPGPSSSPSPGGAVGPVLTPPPTHPGRPNDFEIPAGIDGTVTFENGGFGNIGPFVVPGFLAAASGLLLILLMLAQALGALAWLPVVRRRVGSFGIRQTR
jgi:hypothetical protein